MNRFHAPFPFTYEIQQRLFFFPNIYFNFNQPAKSCHILFSYFCHSGVQCVACQQLAHFLCWHKDRTAAQCRHECLDWFAVVLLQLTTITGLLRASVMAFCLRHVFYGCLNLLVVVVFVIVLSILIFVAVCIYLLGSQLLLTHVCYTSSYLHVGGAGEVANEDVNQLIASELADLHECIL